MPTVAEIIDLYPISQYKAQLAIDNSDLYADGENVSLPQKISNIGSSVKRIYDDDPTDTTLQLTANYLYTLMGIYYQQAAVTVQSGGTIAPVTPIAGLPEPLDWVVSDTASSEAPLADGESSVTLDGTNGMVDLRGYNIDFFRDSIPQYTTNPGDGTTYYSWNRTTGLLTLYNAAAYTGERMRISPTS